MKSIFFGVGRRSCGSDRGRSVSKGEGCEKDFCVGLECCVASEEFRNCDIIE